MTTLTQMRKPAATGGLFFDSPFWRAALAHLVSAWKARQQARQDRGLDKYFRRERSAHERFLAESTDRYDLERREREWGRRRDDFWRVY